MTILRPAGAMTGLLGPEFFWQLGATAGRKFCHEDAE